MIVSETLQSTIHLFQHFSFSLSALLLSCNQRHTANQSGLHRTVRLHERISGSDGATQLLIFSSSLLLQISPKARKDFLGGTVANLDCLCGLSGKRCTSIML